MPVLPRPRSSPQLSQKRQLPPLSLSSDAILKPLDAIPIVGSAAEGGTNAKRDLPPLSLSSDAILKPLDAIPIIGSGAEEGTTAKRDLPPLSLSSDAVLGPLDKLPLLGSPEESTTASKRAPAALVRLDPVDVLDKLQLDPLHPSSSGESAESKRALPPISLSSDAFRNTVPVEGLPLLGDPSTSAKRDASPLLKLDSQEAIDAIPIVNQLGPLQPSSSSSEMEWKRQDDSSKTPPIVQVNTLQFLDKLGRVNLLDPLSPPPPAVKRDEEDDSSKSSDKPPIVRVNTLQFLDKLGKTNLLDPLHAKRGLLPRQNEIAIPAQYAGINDGPAPGAVAGIVLGSVAGFLFIVWLLWLISNGGGVLRSSTYTEDDVVVSRRRSRSPGTRRSHRSQRTEMTSRSPRRERVIRQERIVRDRSAPPPRETSRLRESVNFDERPERRVDGDDIVEVIEEHSSVGVPPPRRSKGGRKSSGYR